MYDSLSQLVEKIHLGEDSTIEFKRELPHRHGFADEIAAFANARGGVILIGVDDHGEIVGIDSQTLSQTEKSVVEICQDSIKPQVSIMTEKLRVDDKNLLKVEVLHSLYVHKSPNGYFKRQGSIKREMPPGELARLMQSRSHVSVISFDEQAVPGTVKMTLRLALYQRFIRANASENETEELLSKRRLLVKDDKGKQCASVAGILMCHDKPHDYIYNSFIQAVYYSGKTKDANYQLDAKDFRGTLDRQILDAFKFVEKHNRVSARKGIGREEKPQYSTRAVFEAVVNAVVHRDYSRDGSKIRLFMFADSLKICSPGELANTLTVDSLPFLQVTRNELLARLLSEIKLEDDIAGPVGRGRFLEQRGEGVGIILRESTELSGKRPDYELLDGELHLTIFAAEPYQRQ